MGLIALIGLKSGWQPIITTDAKSIWLTDYTNALAIARVEKKVVLMDFTGSDWCIWCKRLKREVFDTPQFAGYAKTNLVLLELDFPNNKPQSEALRTQNQELQQQFRIEGFPTIIVLNAEGKPLGKTGYISGGPQAFIEKVESIRNVQR